MCEISKQKIILLTQSLFWVVWNSLLTSQQENFIDSYQPLTSNKKVDFEWIEEFRLQLTKIPIEFQAHVLKQIFNYGFNILYGNEKKHD